MHRDLYPSMRNILKMPFPSIWGYSILVLFQIEVVTTYTSFLLLKINILAQIITQKKQPEQHLTLTVIMTRTISHLQSLKRIFSPFPFPHPLEMTALRSHFLYLLKTSYTALTKSLQNVLTGRELGQSCVAWKIWQNKAPPSQAPWFPFVFPDRSILPP